MAAELKAPLEFSTAVIATQLWSGDWCAYPVADPSLVSYGSSPAACLAEQRAAIELYLAEASPDVLSRFSVPPDASLHEVRVELARFDLPHTQQVPTQVAIGAVVVPFKDGRWVLIPVIGHACRLGPGDDVEETVRKEVHRIVAAREPSSAEFLALLPAGVPRLERLELTLRRDKLEARDRRKQTRSARSRKRARQILESVADPLETQTRSPYELIGRTTERQQLAALLGGTSRLSVLLVGPHVSGKSALFRDWVTSPVGREDRNPVYSTSRSRLIAGMSGLGQWQERVRRVMEAAEELDAILYFDNFADLLSEKSTEYVDISGAMKRFLEENRVRVVGEIDDEALATFERRHTGFVAALARVQVKPLSKAVTHQILLERAHTQTAHESNVAPLTPEASQSLLDLVARYLPYRALPGQAVELEEEVRALAGRSYSAAGELQPLTPPQVFKAFSLRTGIPELLLREDRALQADEIESWFRERLVGQSHAVKRVVETLCVVKAGLQPQGKPLANLLFVGPTGVGKTELARLLATYLFGSADRLFRYDMSEYADAWAADRLLRGTDTSDGTLARQVRQQPFCLLLLDEIEKAHPAVLDLLLQLCGEGRLSDARGRTTHFHNAIVVMTSNLGAAHRRTVLGIGAEPEADAAYYERQVEQTFRPELVNRLDRIIPFHPLSRDEMTTVTELALQKVRSRAGFAETGLDLRVTDSAVASIADAGYSSAYGARALRRQVEDALVAPAARLLSAGRGLPAKSAILVNTNGRELGMHLARGVSTARGANTGPDRVVDIRREIDEQMSFTRIEQIRDRVALLVSQLAMTGTRAKAAVEASAVSSIQAELHRLRLHFDPAEQLQRELHELEERSLLALFEGASDAEATQRAELLQHEFRGHLLRTLLATEANRDEIALMCSEQDNGLAFKHWLLPLFESLPEREWTCVVNIDGDTGSSAHQRWGANRTVEEARAKLKDAERKTRHVLLRIRGPFAGVLLALESGLHRFTGLDRRPDPADLIVRCLTLCRSLSTSDLARPEAQPVVPLSARALSATPPLRDYTPRGVTSLRKTFEIEPAEYWQRFEEIALEQLLGFERDLSRDRDVLFTGPLDSPEAS